MTILHVDDDFEEREIFLEALQSVDPDIHFIGAYSGRNAFVKLQEKLPDLIFLDINMPVMNGFEFLTELKQSPEYAKIPVVIYSTSRSENDIIRSLRLGAKKYIPKPHDLHSLCESIERAITECTE